MSMMRAAIVVFSAMILTACTAPAADTAATPRSAATAPTAPPSSSAASHASSSPTAASLTGDWIVEPEDAQWACIIDLVQRVVHIDSTGTATVTPVADAPVSTLTGPATIGGDAVAIQMTHATPTKTEVDITGTLGSDGVVRGTATAGGVHPSGETGFSCPPSPVMLVRAVPSSQMPAFDTIAGTWCSADTAGQCMTISAGDVAAPHDTGYGVPCYVTDSAPTQGGGGVELVYCPRGVVILPGEGGVEGDLVAAHDNPAYDRLYATQDPPNMDVYFRQADLAAALQR